MINFINVTSQAGINWTGERGTLSAAWTDFNGDGLPDLWLTFHSVDFPSITPKLYINQGNGTFTEISSQLFGGFQFKSDTHGSAWTDLDNDGDPDLFNIVGGQRGVGADPSLLFINQGGTLQERAAQLGVDFPAGRGRSPLWFDWNNDGNLDLLQVNEERPDGGFPTTLFQQTSNGFIGINDLVELPLISSDAAQMADLFGDGKLDIIFQDETWNLYKINNGVFQDISTQFPTIKEIQDLAIADFNGDLVSDIFVIRSSRQLENSVSQIFQGESNVAFAQLNASISEPAGISFKTAGSVTLDFSRRKEDLTIDLTNIYLGASGVNPQQAFSLSQNSLSNCGCAACRASSFTQALSLSPIDPNVLGIKIPTADSPSGLYIGYDQATQTWQANNFTNGLSKLIQLTISTTEPLSNLTPIGFTNPDLSTLGALQPVLLVYDPQTGQYVDQTAIAELRMPMAGKSVTTGDFDNDGDIDIFIVRASLVGAGNIIYKNQGNGTFIALPQAGGATTAPVGAHFGEFNSRLSATTADYDQNGFLDIFVPHSSREATQKNYLGLPPQLYQNQGNGNSWLEIDLEGVVSNRDGIGAKVFVTAGGQTQMREQNGGRHQYGQNFQRLHFGLSSNTQVEKIVIEWSSGIVQKISNVSANQVLHIVESTSSLTPRTIKGTPNNDSLVGGITNDTIVGHQGDDTLIGSAGKDLLMGGDNNNSLDGGSGNDTLKGGNNNDTLLGGSGNDTLKGGNGSDLLNGGFGKDALIGGTGNDIYVLDERNDVIVENSNEGIDTVETSLSSKLGNHLENLTLSSSSSFEKLTINFWVNGTGNSLDNIITGNQNPNVLVGNNGNDTLIGGAGNDILTGGNDADYFTFNAPNQQVDTITDFARTQGDKIVVSAAGFSGGLASGTLASSRFISGAGMTNATNTTQRFIYNTTSSTLFFDGDGNGTALIASEIAILSEVTSLINTDILVI